MLNIRAANIDDTSVIKKLISDLADYEKQSEQVRTTEGDILRDGFGEEPEFRVLIAEWQGAPAGFALFFNHYSTWRGAGFYLEDLFVCPELRGRGIGKALLAEVARAAEQEGRTFIRWAVLNWNQPAIAMYTRLGAEFLDEWRTALVAGEGLKKLTEPLPITGRVNVRRSK
jgi:GNAT superfamily N-acetyltransferase